MPCSVPSLFLATQPLVVYAGFLRSNPKHNLLSEKNTIRSISLCLSTGAAGQLVDIHGFGHQTVAPVERMDAIARIVGRMEHSFVIRGSQRRREIEDRIEPLLILLTQPRIDESALLHLLRRIAAGQNCCPKYPPIGFPRLLRHLLECLDQRGTCHPNAQVIRADMHDEVRRTWLGQDILGQTQTSGLSKQKRRCPGSSGLGNFRRGELIA